MIISMTPQLEESDIREKVMAGVKEIREQRTKPFNAEDIKTKGRERVKQASKK